MFKSRKSPFSTSAKVLAGEGFSDNYIAALEADISQVKKPADAVLGRSYLINALVINGRLNAAYESFLDAKDKLPMKKLDGLLYQNLLCNVIFGLFILDKFKEADALYNYYNDIVLSQHNDAMKRTLAIHEHINGRYENAVTVLAKLLDSECRFVDLCIVKTVLKLDMFARAEELSSNFSAYKGRGELEKSANKLKDKILLGLSPQGAVKMIKKGRK